VNDLFLPMNDESLALLFTLMLLISKVLKFLNATQGFTSGETLTKAIE
jgi:hypothetical protein